MFLSWLFNFEYKLLEIPTPNLVLYLRVDPEVSQKLMTSRYKGNKEKMDIHEKNVGYLNHCRVAAEYCARRLGWKTIECVDNGEMRAVEDIQNEITQVIMNSTVL